MVTVPFATPVAKPKELVVATPVVELVQVTVVAMSPVEASLKVPVAANCCVPPTTTAGAAGVTARDCNVDRGGPPLARNVSLGTCR